MMPFTHVVQTRFNLATPGRESKIRNQPDWLSGRFDLFEQYCLSSMAAQTNQNYQWIIYFDDQTPENFRERIRECQKVRPFHAFYTPLFAADGWERSIRTILGSDLEPALLTTSLDNDDSLASDYVDRLQDIVGGYRGEAPAAFNFTMGYVKACRRIYALRHRSSAFVNLLEQTDTRLKTAQGIPHMALKHETRLIQCPGPGAWLQIVHGGNVSNRARGRLVTQSSDLQRFPASSLADVEKPGMGEIVMDRLVHAPVRFGRDAASAALQRLLLNRPH